MLGKGVAWEGVMLEELLLVLQDLQVSCSDLYPKSVTWRSVPVLFPGYPGHAGKPPSFQLRRSGYSMKEEGRDCAYHHLDPHSACPLLLAILSVWSRFHCKRQWAGKNSVRSLPRKEATEPHD